MHLLTFFSPLSLRSKKEEKRDPVRACMEGIQNRYYEILFLLRSLLGMKSYRIE
jgi:hypothetical protein